MHEGSPLANLPGQCWCCASLLPLQGQDASPLAQWTELENGCICCSAKNDMVRTAGKVCRVNSTKKAVLLSAVAAQC